MEWANLIHVESVIGTESSLVDSVLIVCLTFIVARILLNGGIDFHFGLDLILTHFVFVNLWVPTNEI